MSVIQILANAAGFGCPASIWQALRGCGRIRPANPNEDASMFDRVVLGVLAALTLAAPAAAKDCPTQEFSHEAREQAVRDAPTCQASLEVMEACAYGATGDTSLGEIVIEKCAADFLTKLSKAQRKTYETEVKRCDAKARGGREGTMYISAAAFCRAGVAQRTARRFAKSGAKTGGKPR
jgi:hypothetical protein